MLEEMALEEEMERKIKEFESLPDEAWIDLLDLENDSENEEI